jgi:hypothetical protein
MLLIPTLGRQRQADLRVGGQPGLQSDFQDSQGYTEKPYPTPSPQKKKARHNGVHMHRIRPPGPPVIELLEAGLDYCRYCFKNP